MQSHRPTIMATRHTVAAGHYLAAAAGMEILEAGGNAVDAGVAAGITLGVVHSDIVNIAGVAPIMLYWAQGGEVITIDGLGTWPRAASAEFFQNHYDGSIPEGLLRTVAPAAPASWLTVLRRYGTLRFVDVAAAAIRHAREGFAMYPLMAEIIATQVDNYRRWPSNAAIYLPGGEPPPVGKRFVQEDLARTLQYMVDEEAAQADKGREAGLQAAYDAFYRGDIAKILCAYHAEHGGWLSREDLFDYRVRFEPSVAVRYADYAVHCCGPWSQGPALAQALRMVEGIDLDDLGHNTPAYIHTLTEALKLVFADREHYLGDPVFVEVPLEALLADDYIAARRELIRADRAWPELPPPGDPRNGQAILERSPLAARAGQASHLDTSYVCVVDRHGNVFSATPSDVSSDTPVIPGTGLCPSSRGSQSYADPTHPAVVVPGKRPRLTPNPAIVLQNGQPFMVFGTPGGDVQIQAMLQVFLNTTQFGMDVQSAIESPRFASYSFPSFFAPNAYYPGLLKLEERLAAETAGDLADLGHRIETWPDWNWRAGGVCAIRFDHDNKILHAGADPRRAGYAIGV